MSKSNFHIASVSGAHPRYCTELTEEYDEGREVEYVPITGAAIYPCGYLVGIT